MTIEPVRAYHVVPLESLAGDSEADTESLRALADEATAFVLGFNWCREIVGCYFGCGVGGVVGVFLLQIVPATFGVDEHLWVIVGDVPPAYLVTDRSNTPVEALETYIGEMSRWTAAVGAGLPHDDLIPVNAPATKATARALKKRLEFIESTVVPYCRQRVV